MEIYTKSGCIVFEDVKQIYTTFTILRMKYLVMCKVYTDVGGIK